MIFTGGPSSKRDWASFGLVLSSNWAGFCCENLETLARYTRSNSVTVHFITEDFDLKIIIYIIR